MLVFVEPVFESQSDAGQADADENDNKNATCGNNRKLLRVLSSMRSCKYRLFTDVMNADAIRLVVLLFALLSRRIRVPPRFFQFLQLSFI